jgi:rhamnose utilization protein RhaD (predicted bifunctional aldolase and dehydrogenase)
MNDYLDYTTTLTDIVQFSRDIGRPENDFVILAEGNTSVRSGDDRMIVKATGASLRNAAADDFVEVDLAAYGTLVRRHQDDSVQVIAHTHPTVVNSILCSTQPSLLEGSLFPDQIVTLGRHPLVIPYIDPGLPLAQYVALRLEEHRAQHGTTPKAIYLANHGMFALGSSFDEVSRITDMAVKVARVLLGTFAVGGPSFLSALQADRIDTRPDEVYRRKLLSDDAKAE